MPRVILAVDDSASMHQTVGETLRAAGYELVEASDGAEALELARGSRVDLISTDLNMPRMDGVTLVADLRQLRAYRLTPMLLLTTESSPERKQQGRDGRTG